MLDKLVWLVVKRWPGGRVGYDSAYLSEDDARYAASKLVSDQYMINLETVKLGGSVTSALPEEEKTL